MHHSFHCGLILRRVEAFFHDTFSIQPALGSIPSPGPCLDWRHKSWRVAHPIRKCRIFTKANAQVSHLQPETIRKSSNFGNTSGQSLANDKPFDNCRLNRYSNNRPPFWSLCILSLHGCGWKLYEFESYLNCWSSRLPDTIQSNTRTSMKGLSIKYAVAWPPQGRYSMGKDELGLCCKYTKQLRSAPIFVKTSNSSTIMQYTDIRR